jgi:hypothetical protein
VRGFAVRRLSAAEARWKNRIAHDEREAGSRVNLCMKDNPHKSRTLIISDAEASNIAKKKKKMSNYITLDEILTLFQM